MSIDPYALCPGGRDKKIRFCCPNLVKELEQIESMLNAGQDIACAAFLEQLSQANPDCACLINSKINVLIRLKRYEEASCLAESFYSQEPTNFYAASHWASVLASSGQPKDALNCLQNTLEARVGSAAADQETNLPAEFFQAYHIIARAFLMLGNMTGALTIAKMLSNINVFAEAGKNLIAEILEQGYPVLFRDWNYDSKLPDNFTPQAKEDFVIAVTAMNFLRWRLGIAKLEKLVEESTPQQRPFLLRNLALAYFQYGEEEKALKTLDKYIDSDAPLEKRAEAAFFALCADPVRLGDIKHITDETWTISDFDKALEGFLSNPIWMPNAADLSHMGNPENPAPKRAFILLDRKLPNNEAKLSANDVCRSVTILFIFGKETDRPARVKFAIFDESEREYCEKALLSVLGENVLDKTSDKLEHEISSTAHLFDVQSFVTKRNDIPLHERLAIYQEYMKTAVLDKWLQSPLGFLDNKSPLEAAKDTMYKHKLLALIEHLQVLPALRSQSEIADIVRARLGLEPQTLIEPPVFTENSTNEELQQKFDTIPVWNWHQFDVLNMPNKPLLYLIRMMHFLRETRSLFAFAKELLDRETPEFNFMQRRLPYQLLINHALETQGLGAALEWIEKAKNDAAHSQQSDGVILVMEFRARLVSGDAEAAQSVLNAILRFHQKDSETMEAVQICLTELGLISPNGQPNTPQPASQPQNEAPASKLWIPD